MHQVGGIPDDQGLTAGVGGAVPVAIEIDREVRGDQIKLFAVVRADQIGIADAFFADGAHEHRLRVVERIPVAAIMAEGKINLLGHRRLLAFEGHKEKSVVPGRGAGPGQQGQQQEQCVCQEFHKWFLILMPRDPKSCLLADHKPLFADESKAEKRRRNCEGASWGTALVAQVSKPAVSPISQSADHPKIKGAIGFNGPRVWKPAIPQTWKSAVLRVGRWKSPVFAFPLSAFPVHLRLCFF